MNPGWLETSFVVGDVARTRAFYEALGFAVVDTNDEGRSHTLVAGDCRVSIYQGILDPAEIQLIFWNGDVEAIAEKLIAAGAQIVPRVGHMQPPELMKAPNGDASIMVRDPDGQLVFLIRMGTVTRNEPTAPPPLSLGRYDVALPVKDVGRTVAFYELLGFERRPLPEDEARVAAMVCGDARLTLYQGYLDPGEAQFNFWQGDIGAVAEQVRQQGLGFFREPQRDGDDGAFMLKDPDGRPLFFINIGKYRDTPRP